MKKKTKIILWVTGGLVVLAIIGNFLPDSKNDSSKQSAQSQSDSVKAPKELDAVTNDGINGSVHQVKDYLRENLKDWDSYENIEWYKVQKFGLASDVIGIGEINRTVTPRTSPDKSSAADSTGEMNTGDKVYLLKKVNHFVKIRTQPNDSAWMRSNKLYYWSAWIPENCIKSLQVDTLTKYSVRHKYRAKNSLGGYELSDQTFYLDKTGNVIKVENN